jgi:hypothetical protein
MLTAIYTIIMLANTQNPIGMLGSEYYVPFLFYRSLGRLYQGTLSLAYYAGMVVMQFR